MKQKKSLGQNFFVNKNLAKRIVSNLLEKQPDIIVEIGPGKGYFTQLIQSQFTGKIVLVEKDDELSYFLNREYPNTKVINTDFLEWDLNELETMNFQKILFWGSLPYNVSKHIIRKIIESKYFNSDIFFIIQKEVADKYIATKPNNNLLALETNLFAKPRKLFDISPASFAPQPKVNSSLIQFSPTAKQTDLDIFKFKKFLRIANSQPRKTLKNNLKGTNFVENAQTKRILEQRAQHLSLEEYIYLFSQIESILV